MPSGRTTSVLITTGLVSVAVATIVAIIWSSSDAQENNDDNAFTSGILNYSAATLQVSLEDSQLKPIEGTMDSNRSRISSINIAERHVALKESDMLKAMWVLGSRLSLNVTDSNGNDILKELGPPARDYAILTGLECGNNGRTEEITTGAPVDIYLTRNIAEGEAIFIEYDVGAVSTKIDDKYNFTLASFYPVTDVRLSNNFTMLSDKSQRCTIIPVYENVAQVRFFDNDMIVGYAHDINFRSNHSSMLDANNKTERTTLTVDVGGEPQQSSIETGRASTLVTTYLPVTMTQSISLSRPTENITLYPIFADWDGIVRLGTGGSFSDENNKSVSFSGFGTAVLHGVNTTCTEPYFVEVKDSGIAEDGIKIENTTAPVSSIIYWGDTFGGHFNEPQSGIVYYRQTAGIVPADYNNNNDNATRNNGAGNQEVSGTYHLSLASFYPAKVNLPEQAEMTSFLEVTCSINADSQHVEQSEFPHIFVYDVWFRFK